MNILDIIIVVIMVISICYSIYRGFIREIFSLLGIIAGFIAASQFYLVGANYLKQWIENPSISKIISFLAILIIVTIGVSLLGRLIRKLIKAIKLGWLDRLIGGCFGFVKGLFIVCILLLILIAFLSPQSRILAESKLSPYVITMSRVLTSFVPNNLRTIFREKQKSLTEYWTKRGLSYIQSQGTQ